METTITNAYVAHVLEHGEAPKSVHQFAKKLKMEEAAFYTYFSSFQAIENQVVAGIFEEIRMRLNADEVFTGYSAREKMLAFFYAWAENARNSRSFLQYLDGRDRLPQPVPVYFRALKEPFLEFTRKIVDQGLEAKEVKERKFLSDKYPDALWLQFIFVHKYWLRDHSKDFEKTDAAIEKSVNLAFDLMGQGAFDSAFDFGKFLFQTR